MRSFIDTDTLRESSEIFCIAADTAWRLISEDGNRVTRADVYGMFDGATRELVNCYVFVNGDPLARRAPFSGELYEAMTVRAAGETRDAREFRAGLVRNDETPEDGIAYLLYSCGAIR